MSQFLRDFLPTHVIVHKQGTTGLENKYAKRTGQHQQLLTGRTKQVSSGFAYAHVSDLAADFFLTVFQRKSSLLAEW